MASDQSGGHLFLCSSHRDAVFCEGGGLEAEAGFARSESADKAPTTKSLYWPKQSLQDEGVVYYGNLQLTIGSPAVNTGDNALAVDADGVPLATDFRGNARIYGPAVDIGAYELHPLTAATDRHVFYNNSAWDGNDPAANAADDSAIPTDKTALLRGQSAGFANYTGFSKGINGIMVDSTNTGGTVSASDFTFKVGNDPIPTAWIAAPAPTSVTVRPGAGDGDSDRITIIWADDAIAGEWLEVMYIPSSEVFYFGNAPCETGNSATDAKVTPTDEIGIRNNPHSLSVNPAAIDDAYDFNRDKKVGPTDSIICRNNGTNSGTALQLITLP